jgi:hypothetical protein
MTRTEWFAGDVRPVHVGLYERNYHNDLVNSPDYWDGEYWRYCAASGIVAAMQRRPWRGLAEKPA